MTTRERFQAVMNFKPFDRLPVVEWASWWTLTLDRWRGEGLPPEMTDRYDIVRHLGLDLYMQERIRPIAATCPRPAEHGAGIIANMQEYEALRPHILLWPVVDEARWRQRAALQARGEAVLWFTLDGFFWFARTLLGIERHLYAFYDQPGLMHRINQDLVEWQLRVIGEIGRICSPDFMTFAEDMSYNHGPMLSKPLFDEFMRPYYDRVLPRLREMGTLALIDSDGDIHTPAAWFEEAGLQGILPLERQAGVDIARLRRERPSMRFIGHFDKMVMDKGEKAMRAEFERVLPTAAKGGFIVACDHQTPPAVSLDDYRLYVRLFREYAEKAGRLSQARAQV